MRRRTVLAGLAGTATFLAGCVADDNPDDNGDDGTGDNTGNGIDTVGASPDWAPVPEGETVTDSFETGPDRPTCSADPEMVTVSHAPDTETRETEATVPYPDTEDFDSVPAFVEAFEEAYVTHDVLCDRSGYILDITHTVEEREILDRYSEIATVYLWQFAGASAGIAEEGEPMWVTELAPRAVVYAVDGSGLARIEADDPVPPEADLDAATPDPLADGTLVATFE